MSVFNTLRGLILFLSLLAIPAWAVAGTLRVVDAQTGRPIQGALVTTGGRVSATNADGVLAVPNPAVKLGVRAPGYRRMNWEAQAVWPDNAVIRLPPLQAKALYLTVYGIGDREIRGAALKLLDETDLNALVIDVKGDRGLIPYPSAIPLANEIGARKVTTVREMPDLMARLQAKDVYRVARIVAFKDDLLARARPELAIRDRAGEIWVDREGLAWVDPFKPEVREYLYTVAEEAARLGFDEIQFDYMRFPDTPGLVFSQPNTEANRVAAITGFLAEARRRLTPYNVFLSGDIFGYVAWNQNDTDIGQRLEDMAPHLDYLSLMLYPSGFQFGIPGFRDPVAAPYDIVGLTLANARKRTGLPAARFRPWLQAFRDYAFDRRVFGADEIAAQIRAAEEFGASGWMLWNPRNAYSDAGLKRNGKSGNGNEAPPR